jgi:D-sedoheptulose 7-phosphate isomerase
MNVTNLQLLSNTMQYPVIARSVPATGKNVLPTSQTDSFQASEPVNERPKLPTFSKLTLLRSGISPFKAFNEGYCQSLIEVLHCIDIDNLHNIMLELAKQSNRSKKIYTVGNGGSAGISSEFAYNLSNHTSKTFSPNKGLSALPLNIFSTDLSARMNDVNGELAFATMVSSHVSPNDMLFCISASGESPNIVQATKQAKLLGIPTIALVKKNSTLANLATHAIEIDHADQQIIEDAQKVVTDMLVNMLRRHLNAENTQNNPMAINSIAGFKLLTKGFIQRLTRSLNTLDFENLYSFMLRLAEQTGKEKKVYTIAAGRATYPGSHLAHNTSWDASAKAAMNRKISALPLNELSATHTPEEFPALVRMHVTPNDLLLGLSATGTHTNVIDAITEANRLNIPTAVITTHNSPLATLSQHRVIIEHPNPAIVSTTLQIVLHQLVRMTENHLRQGNPAQLLEEDLANLREKQNTIEALQRQLG